MQKRSLLLFFCLLIGLVVVVSVSPVCAENGWRHWKSGKVTQEIWTEGDFTRIEVDGIPYTLMPGARFLRIVRQSNGGYLQKPIKPLNVYRHQHVNMLVQGFRIYTLHVTQ